MVRQKIHRNALMGCDDGLGTGVGSSRLSDWGGERLRDRGMHGMHFLSDDHQPQEKGRDFAQRREIDAQIRVEDRAVVVVVELWMSATAVMPYY